MNSTTKANNKKTSAFLEKNANEKTTLNKPIARRNSASAILDGATDAERNKSRNAKNSEGARRNSFVFGSPLSPTLINATKVNNIDKTDTVADVGSRANSISVDSAYSVSPDSSPISSAKSKGSTGMVSLFTAQLQLKKMPSIADAPTPVPSPTTPNLKSRRPAIFSSPVSSSRNVVMPTPAIPSRRRSSVSHLASAEAAAEAVASMTYTQAEIYAFLLTSREVSSAAAFLESLLFLGLGIDGATQDSDTASPKEIASRMLPTGMTVASAQQLLHEFRTVITDLMAERFSEIWDISLPQRGLEIHTIAHDPNSVISATAELGTKNFECESLSLSPVNSTPDNEALNNFQVDPLLQTAFVLCGVHPRLLATLMPVAFSLCVIPGLVTYTTTEFANFNPVHLFEARPYLPPKTPLEAVDHGAEIRMRARRSFALINSNNGSASNEAVQTSEVQGNFDVNQYFSTSRAAAPAMRRMSLRTE